MPNMVVCRERMVSQCSKTSYPMSAHPSEHTNSKTQHRNAADTLMSAICILHLIIKIKKAASTIQNINWIQQHLFTSEHNTCLVKWREPAIRSQFEIKLPVEAPKCWPHPCPSKLQSHPTRCAKKQPKLTRISNSTNHDLQQNKIYPQHFHFKPSNNPGRSSKKDLNTPEKPQLNEQHEANRQANDKSTSKSYGPTPIHFRIDFVKLWSNLIQATIKKSWLKQHSVQPQMAENLNTMLIQQSGSQHTIILKHLHVGGLTGFWGELQRVDKF